MDEENQLTCKTCGYFRQHYIWNAWYHPIDDGHCTHPPRNRHCRRSMKACPKWKPQDEIYKKKYIPEN